MKKIAMFRYDLEKIDRIKKLSKKLGITVSQIYRDAVDQYLKKHEK